MKNLILFFSAHNIEHQLDLIKHFQNIEKLLNNGGFFALIIPDKRFCFDHFINESTIADVLNSFNNTNSSHTLKNVIEHRCFTTHNDPVNHWNGIHGFNKLDTIKIQTAIEEFNIAKENNSYVDVHAWQFTPDSFKNIVEVLNSLGFIKFHVTAIYPTIKNNFEFGVILSKD